MLAKNDYFGVMVPIGVGLVNLYLPEKVRDGRGENPNGS